MYALLALFFLPFFLCRPVLLVYDWFPVVFLLLLYPCPFAYPLFFYVLSVLSLIVLYGGAVFCGRRSACDWGWGLPCLGLMVGDGWGLWADTGAMGRLRVLSGGPALGGWVGGGSGWVVVGGGVVPGRDFYGGQLPGVLNWFFVLCIFLVLPFVSPCHMSVHCFYSICTVFKICTVFNMFPVRRLVLRVKGAI